MRPFLSTADRLHDCSLRRVSRMLLVLGALTPAWEVAPGLARAGGVDFGRDVLPILSETCFLCHGPDAASRKADLRLDLKEDALRIKEPVIVPGKSDESEFILRIVSGDADEVMPPPKSNRKLTPRQVELLKRWVDEGAKWGTHWAFEPPRRPEPPEVRDERWPKNAIDRFVRARLDADGLGTSPEAEGTTLIRRATLDLTGVPPTIAEVDAFLADRSPEAFEKVVDRLLASPRYGERMAMDWLDAARYADTNGYQNDFARTMWPWRDWVIDALNRNRPFDRFLVEQLAGDLLPGAGQAQRVATGFNRNNRTVTEAGSIDEEWRVENAIDRVETTATVFLGLTMGCARCHDHKYDPVSQKEFYEFYGFFNSVNEKGVYTETRGNVPPLVALATPEEERRGKGIDDAIAAAERSVREQETAVAARQPSWEADQQNRQETTEPGDWAFRCTLDGDLRIMRPGELSSDGIYRGEEPPAWSEWPHGKALRLDGKETAFVEAGGAVSPDRTDPVSFGGWVRLHGQGAILSMMDDRASTRGFDLLVDKGKVLVHLVHSWPEDAINVATTEPLPKDPDVLKPGSYAANCLLARRMAERGVRFIHIYHMGWDQHGDIPEQIRSQCRDTDQASSALITDLKQRGLLDDTLVIWGGEFGRTIYSQGELTATNYGRDHHPRCFTIWMAGGGVKSGTTYGETDDFSYNIVRDPVEIYDLNATILHLLGIDHEKLIYKFQGRDFRLTDVRGRLVRGILA